jgi:tRNA dimethylallyltransferase
MPTNNPHPQHSVPPNSVVAVVGPTGSGKTAFGVALAQEQSGIIISADSRQVYRGLDIGTNKEGETGSWHGHPARIVQGVPQLLVDVVAPGATFTLHDWLEAARLLVTEIHTQGCLPIVVGGTGLYVSALLEGYELGGGRYATTKRQPHFSSIVLMSNVDRTVLYERSDARFARIFDALVAEVEGLVGEGVSHEWLQTLGLDYRFASYYLTRQMNREIAIAQFQLASRQYIRRQLTWWRHHGQPQRFSTESEGLDLARAFAAGL